MRSTTLLPSDRPLLNQGRESAVPEVSVVIPCFNEEACIDGVVRDWWQQLSANLVDFEIVVIDDGSTDRTPAILASLVREYPELRTLRQANQGHGPALLHAYREARGRWVFHTDSDAQFISGDFWSLWGRREESPYLMGIRVERKDPIHRVALSRGLRLLVRTITGIPVEDINIPYKLIRRDLLGELLPIVPNDTFAPSILLALGAHRRGIHIIQVPVRHLARTTGRTILKPLKLARSCLRALRQLLRFVAITPA